MRQLRQEALRDLIEGGGLPFKQNNRSYRITCPKCGQPKLYLFKSSGYGCCMKCGPDFRGWADKLLSEVYGIPRIELTALLYEGVTLGTEISPTLEYEDFWDEDDTPENEIVIEKEPLPSPMIWGPDALPIDHPYAAAGRDYLESRGISLEMAKRYELRYDAPTARVCFPVVVEGVLRGWQARTIGPSEVNVDGKVVHIPKILTTGEVGGRALMSQDRLKGARAAIMVEGPVDCLKCDLIYRKSNGLVAPTATMGKSFSDKQVQIYLKSGIKRIYLGLDNDAFERVSLAASTFAPYMEVYWLQTPAGRDDLGDSTPEEVWRSFMNAKPLNPAMIVSYWVDHWGE